MLLNGLVSNPIVFFAQAVALIVGITVHEFSHALAARAQGDPTPQLQGRLSLNPLKHLDPLGTIFLLVAGFGWGRPVQFDPRYLNNPRIGSVIVGLAGPAANLLLVVVFGVLLRVLALSGAITPESGVFVLFSALLLMNLVLLIFNLIPIPPLDGSKLLLALLPVSARGFSVWLQRYGTFLLFGLLIADALAPFSVLGWIFQTLINFTVSLAFG